MSGGLEFRPVLQASPSAQCGETGQARPAGEDGRASKHAERNAQIIWLRGNGVGPREIARQLGITASVVAGVLWRADMTVSQPAHHKPPEPSAPRQHRGRTRNSAEAKERARELHRDGLTLKAIAAETGIAPGNLSYICRGLLNRRPVTWSTKRKDRPFKIACLVAVMTGESHDKAAARLGVSTGSIRNWSLSAELYAEASAMAAIVKARWAERKEAERLVKVAEAEAERQRIADHNAPILARMSERHRSILGPRCVGATLREVGAAHGVSFERVRQIEAVWRLRGLIIPSARPLSAATKEAPFIPTGRPRGRKPKVARDFYAQAHKLLKASAKPKRPYTMSDEERERRRAWGRGLAARRRQPAEASA